MTSSPNLSQHFLNFKPNLHLLVGKNTNEEYCVAITWLIFLYHPLCFLSGVQFFSLPDILQALLCDELHTRKSNNRVCIAYLCTYWHHRKKGEFIYSNALYTAYLDSSPQWKIFTINSNFFGTDTYKHRHVSPELMARGTYCGTCRKRGQQREGSASEVHSIFGCHCDSHGSLRHGTVQGGRKEKETEPTYHYIQPRRIVQV